MKIDAFGLMMADGTLTPFASASDDAAWHVVGLMYPDKTPEEIKAILTAKGYRVVPVTVEYKEK